MDFVRKLGSEKISQDSPKPIELRRKEPPTSRRPAASRRLAISQNRFRLQPLPLEAPARERERRGVFPNGISENHIPDSGKSNKQSGSYSSGAVRVGRKNFGQPSSIPTENRRQVLRVLVNTKEHIACPDSGSEKNIMSEALAIDQKLNIRRRPKNLKQFELGSGKLVRSIGRVRVKFQLPGLPLRRSKFSFYIFQACPVPMVLGMSFLAEAKILTKNRHLLETCLLDLSNISSLLWTGSPRSYTLNPAKQPRNRLKCWLDGHCVTAVADTGSDLNLMCPNCAKREGFEIDSRPECKMNVRFGDGTEGETAGQVYVYNLTLDWRSKTTSASTLSAVFHVLPGLPCDAVLGRQLLEKIDVFNLFPDLLSSKPRDKMKPFEYKVLISLGPLSRKFAGFPKKGHSNVPAPGSKEAHDEERHAEMFRRSEKEAEISVLTEPLRSQEVAKEQRKVRDWNNAHANCVHCSPV